ncbi:MAG: 1,4-alpha-glucan branching protein GlgB [Acidimicrobiia bacterium]
MTDADIDRMAEGCHGDLFRCLGAHPLGDDGVAFAVWAPNASAVSVVGDMNAWTPAAAPLNGHRGVWTGVVASARQGQRYKFRIENGAWFADKADPFAAATEVDGNASVIVASTHRWKDEAWRRERGRRLADDAPVSIYEVHLGSWRRRHDGSFYNYREIADALADHVVAHGFTHVEFMPLMEHPFYGSWGYQVSGYFAPTSRYGTPDDLRALVDTLHQRGVGVIFDWVPSHFPDDPHALGSFDGTHLYEPADPRRRRHPDWNSLLFDYARPEVRSFLLSSARYWLEEFHGDGLRIDAVASMLYLDYSRPDGEWLPNEHGGHENLDAISFLRQLNDYVYAVFPDVQTIAEESTAWPLVTAPAADGGLGFGYKWDMGWMHDTLAYLARDPIERKWHHGALTFRAVYAGSEHFVLPLSHDEVVHGKGSLAAKMHGDDWRRRAQLRLLFGYQWTIPGKKLLFMGSELGEWREWSHEGQLDWWLLDDPAHSGIARWVGDLNRLLRRPEFHRRDDGSGFRWMDADDADRSTLVYERHAGDDDTTAVVVANFTPEVWLNYRIGVPRGGWWEETLNSDAEIYGGSGQGNLGGVDAVPVPMHDRRWSITVTVPPLAIVVFTPR